MRSGWLDEADDVAVWVHHGGDQPAPTDILDLLLCFRAGIEFARPALVNGSVWAPGARPRVAFGFTITGGKITGIDLVADPERLRQLDLAVLTD
jgi:RNA polymerase sigma-70 factor, ECF subfamily